LGALLGAFWASFRTHLRFFVEHGFVRVFGRLFRVSCGRFWETLGFLGAAFGSLLGIFSGMGAKVKTFFC